MIFIEELRDVVNFVDKGGTRRKTHLRQGGAYLHVVPCDISLALHFVVLHLVLVNLRFDDSIV